MKKLVEEMQSLDEIVKDSNGLVTDFLLSDWDWDKQRGWVPKPFKDRNHTKRKYEHLPSSPELERGFYYRKETQRKKIPRDNSTRPELCDLLSDASSTRVDGSVSSVPIRSLDKTREPKLTANFTNVWAPLREQHQTHMKLYQICQCTCQGQHCPLGSCGNTPAKKGNGIFYHSSAYCFRD